MCGNASGWSKLAFPVLLVGVILHIVGWATNNWMTYTTDNNAIDNTVGLWRQSICTNGKCEDKSVESDFETDEFKVVQALETVTFCLAVFVLILLMVYLCAELARKQKVAGFIMGTCFCAGICSFVGMIMFITSIPYPYVISWSLGLTIIAMTLLLIAGTLMIPDSFEPDYDYDDDDDDYFHTARRPGAVTPVSIGQGGRDGPKPIFWHSNKPAMETSRWRSY